MRLIDADAEIERLKSDFCKKCEKRKPYPIFGVGCCPCDIQDAIEILDDAPTAQRWIPCSERMPSPHVLVLVSTLYDTVDACEHRKTGKWESDKWNYDDSEITHWMPLPEFYEEDNEE